MDPMVAQTWAERAQAELGAAARFRDLSRRLRDADAHPRILELVERAEREEDEHALLCAEMARTLGHQTGFATPTDIVAQPTYSWSRLTDPRDRLLLDVVLMSCITESFNASLLNTLYAQGKGTEAGRLIHRILKDEVKHAQIGWAYLADEHSRRDCGFVSAYLGEMLDGSVRDSLFGPVDTPDDDTAYGFGVMPRQQRRAHFEAVLQEVIIPGFGHFGIDTEGVHHWLAEKTADS